MFTGIIATLGQVAELEPSRGGGGARLLIVAEGMQPRPRPGDSIAVNGCCLTVESERHGRLRFSLAPETLDRTALGRLVRRDRVHLETALRAGDPLGGHWVQGHIDAVGTLLSFAPVAGTRRGSSSSGHYWLSLRLPAAILPFVTWKGSLAVEGVSLTVAELQGDHAGFAIVPYTRRHTIFATLAPAAPLNLEADILARYLARYLEHRMETQSAPGMAAAKREPRANQSAGRAPRAARNRRGLSEADYRSRGF